MCLAVLWSTFLIVQTALESAEDWRGTICGGFCACLRCLSWFRHVQPNESDTAVLEHSGNSCCHFPLVWTQWELVSGAPVLLHLAPFSERQLAWSYGWVEFTSSCLLTCGGEHSLHLGRLKFSPISHGKTSFNLGYRFCSFRAWYCNNDATTRACSLTPPPTYCFESRPLASACDHHYSLPCAWRPP